MPNSFLSSPLNRDEYSGSFFNAFSKRFFIFGSMLLAVLTRALDKISFNIEQLNY
jgi:hypothetical protein